jgi:hypothetical protein
MPKAKGFAPVKEKAVHIPSLTECRDFKKEKHEITGLFVLMTEKHAEMTARIKKRERILKTCRDLHIPENKARQQELLKEDAWLKATFDKFLDYAAYIVSRLETGYCANFEETKGSLERQIKILDDVKKSWGNGH